MGRPKMTTREMKLRMRILKRNKDLKKAATIGYKRPADFAKLDHNTGEPVTEN